jgi:hypothetical protein
MDFTKCCDTSARQKKKRAFYLQMHTVQFMSTRKRTIEILTSGVGEAELEND